MFIVSGAAVRKQPEGAEEAFCNLTGREKQKTGENCVMGSFMICADHIMRSRRMRWTGNAACLGRGEETSGFVGETRRKVTALKT